MDGSRCFSPHGFNFVPAEVGGYIPYWLVVIPPWTDHGELIPPVIFHSFRTGSHGPVESSLIFPWEKWWIFPVRYVNVDSLPGNLFHFDAQFLAGDDQVCEPAFRRKPWNCPLALPKQQKLKAQKKWWSRESRVRGKPGNWWKESCRLKIYNIIQRTEVFREITLYKSSRSTFNSNLLMLFSSIES